MPHGPQYAGVDTKGRKLWHAYWRSDDMLRDKAGVGRQFYSPEGAQRAIDREVMRAAKADPDAQPLTRADLKRMKRR